MFDNSLKKDVSFGKMIHLFLPSGIRKKDPRIFNYICNLGDANDAIRNERSE